jgi:hypothetical protein
MGRRSRKRLFHSGGGDHLPLLASPIVIPNKLLIIKRIGITTCVQADAYHSSWRGARGETCSKKLPLGDLIMRTPHTFLGRRSCLICFFDEEFLYRSSPAGSLARGTGLWDRTWSNLH